MNDRHHITLYGVLDDENNLAYATTTFESAKRLSIHRAFRVRDSASITEFKAVCASALIAQAFREADGRYLGDPVTQSRAVVPLRHPYHTTSVASFYGDGEIKLEGYDFNVFYLILYDTDINRRLFAKLKLTDIVFYGPV